MPRIPLSTAQKIGHVDAEVNQQSAAGMGFGMDDARALQNAGDAIGQAGRGLGSALMQFGERVQEAEDRLAAAEYETAWNKRQKELETRMKENPGSVKEFGKWATESDAAWENDSKQYTDRMSKRYRDVFETNWRRHRDNAVYRRQELTIQAQVKSLQDGYAKQIQERINAGDYGGARDLVAGISNMKDADGKPCSPFTEDHIKGFGEFVDKSETFGLLRNMFDSGDADQIQTALDLLKETDENGAYVRFTTAPEDESDEYWNVTGRGNLTEEERARWIKYGEGRQNEFELAADEKFLVALKNNEPVYKNTDDLNRALKSGTITEKQFVRYSDWLETHRNKLMLEQAKKDREFYQDKYNSILLRYQETGEFPNRDELKADHDNKLLDDESYSKLLEIDTTRNKKLVEDEIKKKTARAKAEAEAKKAAKEQIRVQKAAFLYDLSETHFASDPSEALTEQKKLFDIVEKCFSDPEIRLELRQKIKERYDESVNGKDVFGSGDGVVIKAFIDEYINKDKEFTGLHYDPDGWSDEDFSQEFQRARYYEVVDLAKHYLRAGKKAEEIKKILSEKIEKLNDGQIRDLLEGKKLRQSFRIYKNGDKISRYGTDFYFYCNEFYRKDDYEKLSLSKRGH